MKNSEVLIILNGWRESSEEIVCSLMFRGFSFSLRGRLETEKVDGADVLMFATPDGNASLSIALDAAVSASYLEPKDLPMPDELRLTFDKLPESERSAGTISLVFVAEGDWRNLVLFLRERPTGR